MNVERILRESLEVNVKYQNESKKKDFDKDIFTKNMEAEYSFLKDNYSAILNISMSPTYEFLRLKKMLFLANKVKEKEVSEHDASVAVGQILVDEIVKPQLNKNN